MNKSFIKLKIEEIFSEDEQAMIWAALLKYDIGPEEADSELYKELEARRNDLIEAFE